MRKGGLVGTGRSFADAQEGAVNGRSGSKTSQQLLRSAVVL